VIRAGFRRQDGQVLPLVALFLVVVAALMVLVVDVARVYIAQQQLQNAVNAAALAAGQALPSSENALNAAEYYDGMPTGKNALFGYDVTANPPVVTFECLSHGADYTAATTSGGPPTCQKDSSSTGTTNNACQPSGAAPVLPVTNPVTTTCNAVTVRETATVHSILGSLFFKNGWNVSASAIAAARGGAPKPLNVEVILDTTNSMGDTKCNEPVAGIPTGDATNEDCAKAGTQALLESLDPCAASGCTCTSASTCTSNTPNPSQTGAASGANWSDPEDEVGIIPVPANTESYPSYEVDCNAIGTKSGDDNLSKSDDEYPPWTVPTSSTGVPTSDVQPGYLAIGLGSDYRNSDAANASVANLNASSDLTEAVYWDQCPNSKYPGNDDYGLKQIGGHQSYLAGAITEAENALLTAPARTPAATNVIVIESDGELNDVTFSNGNTDATPCLDAYEAAQAAKAANIQVYTIEYDSNEACGADNATDDKNATSPYSNATANKSPTTTYDNSTWLMENMATTGAAPYYYDDPGQGSGPTLASDFAAVGLDITESRLIADCTNAPPAC
jgi:hypothetical protein